MSQKKEEIALYSSSSLENLAAPIVIIGGVHGDEPEGVFLATKLLEWLSGNKVKVPWALIPCLNPDGHKASERTNGSGVDLNRNYPSFDWTPDFEKARYNPGPEPASEPEIKALVNLIVQKKPRLLIHCHSWKPCVVCAGPPGLVDGGYLSEHSGYELIDDIGYPTPGSLGQWGWQDLKIPVICIEEAEGVSANETWERFGPALRKILNDDSKENPRNLVAS